MYCICTALRCEIYLRIPLRTGLLASKSNFVTAKTIFAVYIDKPLDYNLARVKVGGKKGSLQMTANVCFVITGIFIKRTLSIHVPSTLAFLLRTFLLKLISDIDFTVVVNSNAGLSR